MRYVATAPTTRGLLAIHTVAGNVSERSYVLMFNAPCDGFDGGSLYIEEPDGLGAIAERDTWYMFNGARDRHYNSPRPMWYKIHPRRLPAHAT